MRRDRATGPIPGVDIPFLTVLWARMRRLKNIIMYHPFIYLWGNRGQRAN